MPMTTIISRAIPHAGRARTARVGDLLTDAELGGRPVRRLDATALLVPGPDRPATYVGELERASDAFAAWDGRVVVAAPDGEPAHRLLVVDRYGQVYAVFDGGEDALPDAAALEEWFRFLATACPECGVLDDPIGRGWVP